MRPMYSADELPALFAEEAMVGARHELGAICQRDAVCRLDYAPMRQNPRSHIAPVFTTPFCSIDLIADFHLSHRTRAAVGHEDQGIARYAVNAAVLAAAVRIDRAVEA